MQKLKMQGQVHRLEKLVMQLMILIQIMINERRLKVKILSILVVLNLTLNL